MIQVEVMEHPSRMVKITADEANLRELAELIVSAADHGMALSAITSASSGLQSAEILVTRYEDYAGATA